MDAKAAQSMQFMSTTWVNSEKLTLKPSVSLSFAVGSKQQWRLRVTRTNRDGHGSASLAASCSSSSNNFPASTLESKSFSGFLNEDLILKSKSQDIGPCLNGRCVYLVGMMGSGKTTIGKILSQALDHSFFDSDTLVEKALNGTSVAEIFKLYGEGFFREKETDVLRKLSLMHRLVVSTGGGAVMRPINWKYMQKGVSVWLDVPLEALAQRIAAVGIDSRPLLHHDAGDAYMKAFKRLSTLFEERGEAYAQANARVSLENIAAKTGHSDVFSITPAQIAIEALEQIGNFLNDEQGVL